MIVEDCCFRDLCIALVQPSRCTSRCQWEIERVDRFGHAVGVTFNCSQQEALAQLSYTGGEVHRKPEVGSKFLFQIISIYTCTECPYRMVHAFPAAGLLTQQYLTLCRLARLGVVGKRYIYQGKGVGLSSRIYTQLILFHALM